MPTTPSVSAMAAAMASRTSVNDVRAIDASYTCCIVRSEASDRPAFTDQTARRTSPSSASLPASALRITKVTDLSTSIRAAR